MHYTNSLPGCYSNGDRNVGGSGGVWPSFMNDRSLKGGISYDGLLTPPTEDQFSGYKKEIIRQTMLKHEAIFRDQVRELHRLYKRQRELTEEIKRRELSKQNTQILAWQHASLPWVNPSTSAISFPSAAANVQPSSSFPQWKNMQANPGTAHTVPSFKGHELIRSAIGNPKRKMLDLELPATEYIGNEEESRFIKRNVYELPMVPFHPPNRTPVKKELTLFPSSDPVNSICESGSSNLDPLARSTKFLADLNEPIAIEDEVASDSVSSWPIPCQFSSEVSGACLKSIHVQEKQPELLSCIDEAGQSMSSFSCLPPDSPKSPSRKRAKSSEANASHFGDSLHFGKGMDLNMAPSCSPERDFVTEDGAKKCDLSEVAPEHKETLASDGKTNKERDSSTEDITAKPVNDQKLPGSKNLIDLNSSVNEFESPSSPIKAVADADLEGPISPENKEGSPPRGESEENFLETDEQQLQLAAEAIVLISTTAPPQDMPETPEASVCDSLILLAEIVSSVSSNNVDDSELSSEEGCYLGANLEMIGDKSSFLLASQQKMGKGRRERLGKSNQVELLPSFSAPSHHVASDELKKLGRYVKTAGFNAEKYLGKRNSSRCLKKAKKLSGNVISDYELGSLLKGWGKINRRQRSGRVPSNKRPRVIC